MTNTNPYTSPESPPEQMPRAPGSLRVLWAMTAIGTVAFITNMVAPDITDDGAQIFIFAIGFNLIAVCAGIGIYVATRYDIRFLPPGALACAIVVVWAIALGLRPTAP